MLQPILPVFTGQFPVTVNNGLKQGTIFTLACERPLCILHTKPDSPALKRGRIAAGLLGGVGRL